MLSGMLGAPIIRNCCVSVVSDGLFVDGHFTRERCLDGAHNHILARPQIARELRLERMPNATSRQFFARADGGADESRDGGLEYLA